MNAPLSGTEPRDASTVIVVRESAEESFEILLIKRAQKSAFMGGAHVFPGGRIDPADADPTWHQHLDGGEGLALRLAEPDLGDKATSLYVGAARETLEEANVLLATCTSETARRVAREIASGTAFLAALAAEQLKLTCSAIWPWARWVTPSIEPKRFDTRFFVVRMPQGQEALHDGHEATMSDWLSPRQALGRHHDGTIVLAPPTLRTLEELSVYASSDALFEAAKTRVPPLVRPLFVEKNGVWTLLLPGDPDHPERDPVLAGPTRIVLEDGRWWSRPA